MVPEKSRGEGFTGRVSKQQVAQQDGGSGRRRMDGGVGEPSEVQGQRDDAGKEARRRALAPGGKRPWPVRLSPGQGRCLGLGSQKHRLSCAPPRLWTGQP